MRLVLGCITALLASGLIHITSLRADEGEIDLKKLPKSVTASVKKMFPKAEWVKATKEEDGDEVTYEITIEVDEKKIDVTVDAEGEIEEFEKEIDIKKLPKEVVAAIKKKFGKASLESAEAVYSVEDDEQELEFYEVQIETADDKELEVKVKANGKIITDNAPQEDKEESEKKEEGKKSKKESKEEGDDDDDKEEKKESKNEKVSKKPKKEKKEEEDDKE